MTEPRRPIGIVLAGGRSSRFGRDKLAELIDGEPLLWRPIRALAAAGCVVAVVVLPPTGVEPRLPLDLVMQVRLIRDREPFAGPLAGVLSGLAVVADGGGATTALVVGGDQPSLSPAVLTDLVERVRSGRQAAALTDPSGRMRPLPMALATGSALLAATRLREADERRLRVLPAALDAEIVPFAIWCRLDPSARTLVDVDQPSDLPIDRPADPPTDT